MITRAEILKGQELPEDLRPAYEALYYKANEIRKWYGKPLIVTSGYRSMEEHLRIYEEKGVAKEFIPMGSKHLKCLAIDFADPFGFFKNWILNHMNLIEGLDLYFEDFYHTHGSRADGRNGWVHMQIVPPKSGKRFFIP